MKDMLFIERNCPHCGMIRAIVDMEAVMDDDFRGTDGQEFYVFAAQSNAASIELLERFDLVGYSMPVLVCHDGTILTKTKEISQRLNDQGMASRR